MQPTSKSVAPSIYTELRKAISELREEIDSIFDTLPKLPPVDKVVTLSSTPIHLSRNKRRYSLLFMRNPIKVSIDIPWIGQFTLTLVAGWNELSFPSGTEVALTSDGEMTALYRCIDTLA